MNQPDKPYAGKNILLIGNDKSIDMLLQSLLEDLGAEVCYMKDSKYFIGQTFEFGPDLIIVNSIHLRHLIAKFKAHERLQHLPVLFLSAAATISDFITSIADDNLEKPVDLNEFFRKVTKSLHGAPRDIPTSPEELRLVRLLHHCRYYNGEEYCPTEIWNAEQQRFWAYEQHWVQNDVLREDENMILAYMEAVKNHDAGVHGPLYFSLIASLHNRFLTELDGTSEGFLNWFNSRYAPTV